MSDEQSTIKAIVRALDGDFALLEVDQRGCGRCHEEGGCGGQNLTQMFSGAEKTYRVENTLGAGIGERVTLVVSPGSLRRTANFAYGVPLLALLLGASLGLWLGGDAGAMLGGGLGLLLGFVQVRSLSWRVFPQDGEQPRMLARCNGSEGHS